MLSACAIVVWHIKLFRLNTVLKQPLSIRRWFKNKLEIFHGRNIHIEHNDCQHRIIIKRLSPKDAGKYTVSCDDIKSTAWLNVEGNKCQIVTFNS